MFPDVSADSEALLVLAGDGQGCGVSLFPSLWSFLADAFVAPLWPAVPLGLAPEFFLTEPVALVVSCFQ